MRKGLSILAAFLVISALSAQPGHKGDRGLTQGMVKVTDDVGDFTITDSDGNTWNLYEQLNLGKTVFIDLFYTT